MPQIQWLQSYVTGDKIYCVYIAPSEEAVREHARLGGFQANRISEVQSIDGGNRSRSRCCRTESALTWKDLEAFLSLRVLSFRMSTRSRPENP